MGNYLAGKKVLVTGGAGFVGSYVVRKLRERGCSSIVVPRRQTCDLTKEAHITCLLEETHPNVVIHLAAVVGGIGANRRNPGQFFYDNLIMGIQLMEQARQHQVEKFVALGTVCSYPIVCPSSFS